MGSSNNSADGSESIGAASEEDSEVQLVLALQAPPINFSVEEIQPDELMTDEQLCWGEPPSLSKRLPRATPTSQGLGFKASPHISEDDLLCFAGSK
jgi:hypothetical protein